MIGQTETTICGNHPRRCTTLVLPVTGFPTAEIRVYGRTPVSHKPHGMAVMISTFQAVLLGIPPPVIASAVTVRSAMWGQTATIGPVLLIVMLLTAWISIIGVSFLHPPTTVRAACPSVVSENKS